MPTCLADLLADLARSARDQTRSRETAADAAAAIGYLGRSVQRLTAYQRNTSHGGLAQVLAGACAVLEGGTIARPARLANLAGAAADTIGVLDDELNPSTHYAITVAVGDVLHDLADTYLEGKRSLDLMGADRLHRLRRALTNLDRAAALEPPAPDATAILTRPIPGTPSLSADAAHTMGEAVAGLVHLTQPHRPISLSELLAVTIAVDSLTQAAHRLLPDFAADHGFSAAWRRVQHELGPFNDGSRRDHADRSPLVGHALDLHAAAAALSRQHEPNRSLARATGYALDQISTIAQNLSRVVDHWAANRILRAYAIDIDAGERYPAEFLAGRKPAGMVPAGRVDLLPVRRAIHDARTETAQLARSFAVRSATAARDMCLTNAAGMAPGRHL